MKVGRRLAIKVLNATQVRAGRRAPASDAGHGHRAAGRLHAGRPGAEVVREAGEAFAAFDYTRALEVSERFFWTFCDDYVELVKERAYGERADDAGATGSAPGGPGDRAVRAAAAARADHALRHRGGLVLVAGRLDPPRAVADRGRARRAERGRARRRRRAAAGRRRPRWPACAAPSRRPRSRQRTAGRARRGDARRRRTCGGCGPARPTCARPAGIDDARAARRRGRREGVHVAAVELVEQAPIS